MGKGKEKSSARTQPTPQLPQLDSQNSDYSQPPPEEEDSPIDESLFEDTTTVLEDGRISVNLDTKLAHVFAKLVEASEDFEPVVEPPPAYEEEQTLAPEKRILPLSIVVHVVGSRGDVQPFVALGQELQSHGHRVRIATHSVFKDFVQSAGLEFYPIGGDPAELMAYMVKNPGLIPSMKTLREGDIGRKREMIREILEGCWESCITPDLDTEEPFVANAIIANPPSFAHVHCAEALGIPLHIIFTMPWTPTRAYSHPLANVRNNTNDPRMANYISYGMVQLLTWNGIGDVVQRWRRSIDLEPLPASEAPFIMESLEIPHTYCWSPALVPKPKDWGKHIDVCGFLFRDMPSYNPPPELEAFLKAGPPPVYIGFGSIVVDDPESLIKTVLDAVQKAGVRAIVSKGWSNLASSASNEKIYFIGDCPHEWLFQQVAAVVHHGGAGTTACGLLNGRPTTIVPFFGDQPFWGKMVATAKAGPDPIPYKKLNSENLSRAILYCLTDVAQEAATAVADRMSLESGVKTAIESFHRNLPVDKMGCDLIPSLPATWIYTKSKKPIKLSGAAAEILLQSHKLKSNDLIWYQPKPIHVENRRWDVVSGTVSSGIGLNYDLLAALSGVYRNPREMYKLKEKQRARAISNSGASGSSITPEGETSDLTTLEVAKMVGASAKGLAQFTGVGVRGLLADVPVAVAEGLRNTPKLYGEKVPDHAPVTDWKSGITVAGTNFAQQMAEGLSDIVVQPAKGLVKDGAIGFGKGLAKGAVQTLTKPGSAALGLVGYTSQGIYKSIRTAIYSKTKKSVASAARVRDKYYIRANREYVDTKQVLSDFMKLSKKPSKSDSDDESGTMTPRTIRSETHSSISRPTSTFTAESIGTPDSEINSPYPSSAIPSYTAPLLSMESRSVSGTPSIPSPTLNAESERAPVYELDSPASNSKASPNSTMLTPASQPSLTRSPSVRRLARVPVPKSGEAPASELDARPSSVTTPSASELSDTKGCAATTEPPSKSTTPLILEPSNVEEPSAIVMAPLVASTPAVT